MLILQRNISSFSYYLLYKRVFDICGSVCGLILLLVLLPAIALLIFADDHGPIFYKQIRIGMYGRFFTIYKFRSMVQHADAYFVDQPLLQMKWQSIGKIQHDPRITRIGRFLRRYSLDELPQMLNVFRGEMSLVGPRAIQEQEVSAFGNLLPLRQRVKPGITGLWQVSGRSNTSYEQRCILDCTYVLECSFKTDLHILLKTFSVVLRGIGTY